MKKLIYFLFLSIYCFPLLAQDTIKLESDSIFYEGIFIANIEKNIVKDLENQNWLDVGVIYLDKNSINPELKKIIRKYIYSQLEKDSSSIITNRTPIQISFISQEKYLSNKLISENLILSKKSENFKIINYSSGDYLIKAGRNYNTAFVVGLVGSIFSIALTNSGYLKESKGPMVLLGVSYLISTGLTISGNINLIKAGMILKSKNF